MTHSGQGDEPQHPAARPAHEGVVLPGDGSEPWHPASAREQAAQQAGEHLAPAGGQPWGQPWGPQDGPQEQETYQDSSGYHQQSYGPQDGASYGGQPQGVSYGGPQPLPQPLPAEVPAPGSADATQYLPPVPGGDQDATQYIAHLPPQMSQQHMPAHLPQQHGSGPDEQATQFIAPVPAQDPLPPGDAYGIRQGEPEDRTPPAEFDSLFRTEGPAGQNGQESPDSTQQLPQFDQYNAGPPRPPRAYEPQPAGYEPQPPQGRGAGRRKSSKGPLIAAVVVGCAIIGLGAGALMSGGDDKKQDDSDIVSSASSPATAPSSQTADDPAKPQAESLDKLLATSNNSRAAVIRAVGDIGSCDNLDQASDDLRDAAGQRRALVDQLKGLSIDQLPNHEELASSLTEGWQASAAADDHYADWADQSKRGKNCKGGHPRRTQAAAEANRSSGDATKAKNQASKLWNSIATKYGLTKRASTEL